MPRGTVAVIEGDNGAGKTTLVRILATVVSPDPGAPCQRLRRGQPKGLQVRRSIGVSFANERSLYWRINAYQNLELFGKIAGLSKKVIDARSASLLEELHLARGRWTGTRMSTGQRQRLMVARALLTDPSVVLLDEPFRGLDEEGVQTLINLVTKRKQAGTTILIVAPLIAAVLPVADATYRIDAGTVRAIPATGLGGYRPERRERPPHRPGRGQKGLPHGHLLPGRVHLQPSASFWGLIAFRFVSKLVNTGQFCRQHRGLLPVHRGRPAVRLDPRAERHRNLELGPERTGPGDARVHGQPAGPPHLPRAQLVRLRAHPIDGDRRDRPAADDPHRLQRHQCQRAGRGGGHHPVDPGVRGRRATCGAALVMVVQQGSVIVAGALSIIGVISGTLFPISELPSWLQFLPTCHR